MKENLSSLFFSIRNINTPYNEELIGDDIYDEYVT